MKRDRNNGARQRGAKAEQQPPKVQQPQRSKQKPPATVKLRAILQPKIVKILLHANGNLALVVLMVSVVSIVAGEVLVRRPGAVASVDRSANAESPIGERRPGSTDTDTRNQDVKSVPAREPEAPQESEIPIEPEPEVLNALITVVARDSRGTLLRRWRTPCQWVGPLPVHYHGSRSAKGWRWSDPAGRKTRLPSRPGGIEGVPVEIWAARHHAATIDISIEITTDRLPSV